MTHDPFDVATAARIERATAGLDTPFAVLDRAAFERNADDMVRRAGGKPIRVASKSVRCRQVLRETLTRPGYRGILGYSVAEAIWLAAEFDDVVVGYPSVERAAIAELAADEALAARVTVMVDSVDQLDLIDAATGPRTTTIKVCLDLDASLRLFGGRLHLGTRRSPVHRPDQVATLAATVATRTGFALDGLMAYEGQIAGLADSPPGRPDRALAIRAMQRRSSAELAERRAAAVGAITGRFPLRFVNGGGTGSLESTSSESAVTEVAAGSGLYSPAIFDHYRAFHPSPALLFALGVARRPGPGCVTVSGGGWIASGPPAADRLPLPIYPHGLAYLGTEGAGEVQTPLVGAAADALAIGDRVWFRHAKAGEVCERVAALHVVDGETAHEQWPTYRGEGRTFL